MAKESNSKSARRRSRELVVQGLYQWLVTGEGSVSAADVFIRETPDFHKADEAYYTQMLKGVVAQVAELREALVPCVDRPLVELSPVEHGVLLVAAYELKNELSVPYKVVINEAVEITKSFGGTDGFKYVNGVLDKLAGGLRALEVGI
ncbi:transcription antitermination factor NusB [Hydromonas duriensis]|uniref:Transcription antitermination protein NusB n=1 Tax=Hydromonas duriensis TaxID=1527608 RepID=A0A4R6Y951_9BURK|nr:transcription antitermination factor NusB [Hydromonas duriensis]TDR31969.1 NusB antitermination factor [Hydromonas duriensis]